MIHLLLIPLYIIYYAASTPKVEVSEMYSWALYHWNEHSDPFLLHFC